MVTWNDIKIADKGFLINLNDRSDRLLDSISEFDKLNIKGVERFDAVKFEESSVNGVVMGCTQSHIDILMYQVDNNLNKIIIFEDDFCLDLVSKEEYHINDQIILNLTKINADLLLLGSCLIDQSHSVSENVIKPNNFVQTTCYISNLNFAKFVINNFDYLDKESLVYGEAIDTFYSVLSSKSHWLENREKKDKQILLENNLKIYFHYPILFSQRPSYSNLINRHVNYLQMNKFRNLLNLPKI